MERPLFLLSFFIFIHNWQKFISKFCISTNLSKIICLINVHILVCQYARCDCKLWNVYWFFLCFFFDFSDIINNHSSLKCYIFTKLSQTVCLINIFNLICQYAKCDSKLLKVLSFNCACLRIKGYNFIKLSQIEC